MNAREKLLATARRADAVVAAWAAAMDLRLWRAERAAEWRRRHTIPAGQDEAERRKQETLDRLAQLRERRP